MRFAKSPRLLLLAVFLASALDAFADPAPPIFGDFATAHPVRARHGMVVTQEAAASRVGLEILQQGGNAVDAAVAVGFALAVTLPRAGNIGGGGFMLVHLAAQHKTVAIDYREVAPALTTKDVFLNADGEADPFKSRFSGLAIGVPGTVAGLELAWRKYGSGKFTFADLVAPAAKLAHQGLTVDEDLVDSLPFARRSLALHPASARIYLKPDLSPPDVGDHIALDDLAATLDRIAAQGAEGFYKGPVAEKIVAAVQEMGGRMTLDDLANYRAVEREPVSGTYRGHEIVSMPPPSSGGAHIIEILNILEGFPIADEGLNSAASIHAIAEAEKLAYADRARYLGDPDFLRIPLKGLTSKAYADRLRATIPSDRARPAVEIMSGDPQRGRCGRQHLSAHLFLRQRIGRRGHRRSSEQRTRRFFRQTRRRQRLWAARGRRERAGARQAPALVDEPNARLQGWPTRNRHRQPGRIAHHLDRVAGPAQCARSRAQHCGGGERAAGAPPGIPRRIESRTRHLARYDPASDGDGLHGRHPRGDRLGELDRARAGRHAERRGGPKAARHVGGRVLILLSQTRRRVP